MGVLLKNNAKSRLASSLTAGATTLSVTSGDGSKFPSPTAGQWFPLTVIKASGVLEIMRCTARSGDVLTVTRAQEGTAAQAFTAGDRVELRMTAGAVADASVAHAETAGAATTATTAAACTGNSATATKLAAARKIGGVSFDGTADINLPGVNTAGNQNTTGNAATATKLATARKINNVPFDGTRDITIQANATAASVMSANAAAAFGAVGTMAFLRVADANTPIVAGSTYAGSALRTSGVVTRISSDGNIFGAGEGAAVSGTWRAMGTCAANGGSSNFPSTVFLRIS